MRISTFGDLKKYSLVMAATLMLNGTFLAAGPLNKDLYDRAAQAKPDVLKLLESLVNVDSGTGSEKDST